MTLRSRIYLGVVAANTGVPQTSVYSSGAVGVAEPGTSATRPFIVIRFQPDNPGLFPRLAVSQQRWNAWVHDEPGTMENIDKAVKALKEELPTILIGDGEGVRILDNVWEGTFADGYDDHFGTNLKYVDFMTTYKPIP